jgi:hypothetical protein
LRKVEKGEKGKKMRYNGRSERRQKIKRRGD